ncbi:zf-HC2 domain-containing protein [Sporichthya sp.]|uniref:zf-HC2 domain-containing protein n=1 Tax=Sporichthya sp. TaxID=65475 RepID=UPI0017996F61|nr:zf-HC2 domain-containing protein [Sporichthya sp.]MBA3742247.1 zf-HC2 domain-containing protein [Sporichthya sp.]
MDCERWRDALSARLDGEPLGVDEALLEAHLATCRACCDHADALAGLHRSLRLQSADQVPDLTDAILTAAADDRRRLRVNPTLVLRWVLVLIAALEIGLASPDLLGRWHTGSELGTWSIAVGVGFLSVAIMPTRAAALVPMLGFAGILTAIVTTRHLMDGAARLSDEWPHGLVLAGVVVLVAISRLERVDLPGPRPARTVDADGKPVRVRRAA